MLYNSGIVSPWTKYIEVYKTQKHHNITFNETRLWNGRPMLQFPVNAREFCYFPKTRYCTGCEYLIRGNYLYGWEAQIDHRWGIDNPWPKMSMETIPKDLRGLRACLVCVANWAMEYKSPLCTFILVTQYSNYYSLLFFHVPSIAKYYAYCFRCYRLLTSLNMIVATIVMSFSEWKITGIMCITVLVPTSTGMFLCLVVIWILPEVLHRTKPKDVEHC